MKFYNKKCIFNIEIVEKSDKRAAFYPEVSQVDMFEARTITKKMYYEL